MKKIGISGNRIFIKGFKRDYVLEHYAKCVERKGGVPIILPITSKKEVVEEYIKIIDALILTGGQDVDPNLYGEELYKESEEPSVERDQYDFMLIEAALKKGIPILGICRGMQILNVYLGGKLHQDIKYHSKTNLKHVQSSMYSDPVHSIKISKGSYLYEKLGEESRVNSIHHQCIKEVASSLNVVAVSIGDGIIEAYESKEGKILGVQWHPEMMCFHVDNDMSRIFDFLLEEK